MVPGLLRGVRKSIRRVGQCVQLVLQFPAVLPVIGSRFVRLKISCYSSYAFSAGHNALIPAVSQAAALASGNSSHSFSQMLVSHGTLVDTVRDRTGRHAGDSSGTIRALILCKACHSIRNRNFHSAVPVHLLFYFLAGIDSSGIDTVGDSPLITAGDPSGTLPSVDQRLIRTPLYFPGLLIHPGDSSGLVLPVQCPAADAVSYSTCIVPGYDPHMFLVFTAQYLCFHRQIKNRAIFSHIPEQPVVRRSFLQNQSRDLMTVSVKRPVHHRYTDILIPAQIQIRLQTENFPGGKRFFPALIRQNQEFILTGDRDGLWLLRLYMYSCLCC